MAKRPTKKAKKAKKPVAAPAPAAPEQAVAPKKQAPPEPVAEEVVEQKAFTTEEFLAEARAACAKEIEAGGGLDPALPGTSEGTKGYKLIPNLNDVVYVELAARIKAKDPTAPPMPEVNSVVFYLLDGARTRYRRPRERYNPEEEA